MEKKYRFKSNSGISLVTVIITIIVIIILAAISFMSLNTQNQAITAKYVQEFAELRKSVDTKRLINSKNGVENADNGFSRVYVVGDVPYNFMGLGGNGDPLAYLVSLDYVGCDEMSTGKDYKRFEASDDNIKTVTFGKDDVYVYDSLGRVFYAKGFKYNNEICYEELEDNDGKIKIISVRKELSPDNKTEKITIIINSEAEIKEVNVSNGIFDENADKISDGKYEIEITENGTYEITAEDSEGNTDKVKVKITEIEGSSVGNIDVVAVVANGVLQGDVYHVKDKTAQINIISPDAKYMCINKNVEDEVSYLPFAEEIERTYTTEGEKTLYICKR